jgi:MoaA/NifB/PqqE/SkfB family radical SAM enzyme
MPAEPSNNVEKTVCGKADFGRPAMGALAPKAKKSGIRLVPAVCDVSVTNACNAKCDFCSYAYHKQIVKEKRWIDPAEFARALPVLHRSGIRYVNFQGGEPLLHPKIEDLVADTRIAGIKPALITNGWFLPQKIESLVDAGLGTLLVSIDSHSLEEHERNRGLYGVGERIQQGLVFARSRGVPTMASVTVSRLVRFQDLPELLRRLGFDGVTFSYPRRTPFESSSLVFSQNSPLINFKPEELINALEAIKSLKSHFPVLNPKASLEDIQRHVRGEEEQFECVGGRKYFYLDWDLNIWRCEAWSKPLGSIFDFDRLPECRDRCTACMMSCYRDTSVLMHAGVAVEDAVSAARVGRLDKVLRLLFRRTVARSLWSVASEARQVLGLAGDQRR